MRAFIIRLTNSWHELFIGYVAAIVLASAGFWYFEAATWGDSIWWAFVTATTTGYGDFFPKTDGGRAVGVALMHAVHWFLWPLLVLRVVRYMDEDKHQFTDSEQREIIRHLRALRSDSEAEKARRKAALDG